MKWASRPGPGSSGSHLLRSATLAIRELLLLGRAHHRPDPQSRAASSGDLIIELRASGRSIVLTTHYMDTRPSGCAIACRAIVDHGRVIALGSPREFHCSAREHVVEFMSPGAADGPFYRISMHCVHWMAWIARALTDAGP
jgi:hypothetical protein